MMSKAVFVFHLIRLAAATWYRPTDYEGVTFCGQYTDDLIENQIQWVALDVDLYLSDEVSCWDEIVVEFQDGSRLYAYALDAGPFRDYYIEQYGPDVPIIVDIPDHLWDRDGRSRLVSVIHLTGMKEELEEMIRR